MAQTKRRGAIVEVDLDLIAQLLAPESCIHHAAVDFWPEGFITLRLWLTHPDLPEVEEGMIAPRKVLTYEIRDGRPVFKGFADAP